jgi:DNA (cytosine-5)-methyltransferase 1
MPKKKNKPLRVVELFAGVGGFRLGLEGYKGKSPLSNYKKTMPNNYKVIWSNQWEPSTKRQHANEVYIARWSDKNHYTEDIERYVQKIPEHDVLVGGFPCQDYSVATTLKSSKGLIGKKGVLWWHIHTILKNQGKKRPKYLILENVDRLLGSPAFQRGRDFAIMLSCLDKLGYNAEWRVINSADYRMPQRRRRVFIIGYNKNTQISKKLTKSKDVKDWLVSSGILASSFNVYDNNDNIEEVELKGSTIKLSKTFGLDRKTSQFKNTGVLKNGKIFTLRTYPVLNEKVTLKSILFKGKINEEYFIDSSKKLSKTIKKPQIRKETKVIDTELKMWEYLKGSKNELRKTIDRDNSNKFHYYKYSEGGMFFPDDLNKPSRTIITNEGGPYPSRFKHVIQVGNKMRRLIPVELERLNLFPSNHTKLEGITDSKRAFFMGNALVVGVVELIGKELFKANYDS